MDILIWIWIIVMACALILEASTMQLVSIWFGLGALVSALLAIFEVDPVIQFGAFAVVSILAIILTRPLARKLTKGKRVATNADRHIGHQAIVLEEIKPLSPCTVKLDGVVWTAFTDGQETMAPGEVVTITEVRGAKVVAKKI